MPGRWRADRRPLISKTNQRHALHRWMHNQTDLICARRVFNTKGLLAAPNGGPVRVHHGIFVPLAAPGSPGYIMAQWTVSRAGYLYIAALEMNALNCREEGCRSEDRSGQP